MQQHGIAQVIGGSLVDGLIIRLNHDVDLDSIAVGKFVCVHSGDRSYFSLITDLSLESTNPLLITTPPQSSEQLFAQLARRHDLYVRAHIRPMLTTRAQPWTHDYPVGSVMSSVGAQTWTPRHSVVNRENSTVSTSHPEPVKTIPTHFSTVTPASAEDVARVFGSQSQGRRFFSVGSPLDMSVDVCIDLERFVERSNGIFGKTGTGKTFITRTILAGLVHTNAGVNLVFDMHSEYGLQARSEATHASFVKGLKSLFPDRVAIFSLDPEATRKRGCSPDVEVQLSYRDVRVEDVILLADELVLHPTALEAAYLLSGAYGRDWLQTLLEHGKDLKMLSDKTGAHPESLSALYRKLKRLEQFSFLSPSLSSSTVIDTLLEYLNRGTHVILEFGRQTSMLCYLLIASIVTRRIHHAYVTKTENFLASQNPADEPRKLVITIEEAHKFLNPAAAKQTIFGLIAREMRKYYVSLLVVDQRPSCIDTEVLSQLGTKIIAQLSDENDISSVLTGTSNASNIKTLLSTLSSKKQALLIGHAVPMPIIIKTREYDETFYKAMLGEKKPVGDTISELFG